MKSKPVFSEMCMNASATEKQAAGGTEHFVLSRETVFFAVLALLCLLLVFQKSIFFSAPISRINLIEQLDCLYNPALLSSEISVAQDPSACLQSIPRQSFVQNSIVHKDSPIWNPLTGCGQPVIADPANTVFGPIDMLFAPGNQQLYNLGIVVKILLGAAFSFLLFLRYGASAWAACTAALGFSLSARVLRGVELATDFEFLPAVFLVFSLLKPDSSWRRIALCALGLALCYSSLHPEVFFIGVASATVLWMMAAWQYRTCKQGLEKAARCFSGLALMTIALVAPFLIPFLEFMQQAQSYKFTDSSTQFIPLTQLAFFLSVPKIAGTLFPGWVVIMGLASGILAKWNQRNSLLVMLSALILFACRPGFLASSLSVAPFSYLLPEYALGPILLLVCIIGAVGLSKSNSNTLLVAFSAVLILLPQTLVWAGAAPQELGASLTGKAFAISLIAVFASLLLFLLPRFLKDESKEKRIATAIMVLALPVVNLLSLLSPVKAELPITKILNFPPVGQEKLIETLKSAGAVRMTACGDRLLQPNTSLMYGLEDLRTCSPLNNKRYLKFMNALGAKPGYCNMMQVPTELSPMLDLASVQLLLSTTPIRSKSFESPKESEKKSGSAGNLPASKNPGSTSIGSEKEYIVSGRIMPGIRLIEARTHYDASAAALESKLSFRTHGEAKDRYQVQVLLRNEKGKDLWQSPYLSIRDGAEAGRLPALPDFLPAGQEGRVSLLARLRDSWTSNFVPVDGKTLDCVDSNTAIVLAKVDLEKREKVCSTDGRFELVYESPELIRVYKNNFAAPNAYIVHQALEAKSEDDALRIVSDSGFNWKSSAVIETGNDRQRDELDKSGLLTANIQEANLDATDSAKEISRSNCRKEFAVNLKRAGIFVLTDIFYPGWNAELDGKPIQIDRANYLFRGVLVPPGEHRITFQYAPLSFGSALIASLAALAAIVAICVTRRRT